MPSSEQQVVDAVPKQLYIGGQWRDGSGGGTIDVEDPATGQTLCAVADGTPEDAEAALAAADGGPGRVGGHAAERAQPDPPGRVRAAE